MSCRDVQTQLDELKEQGIGLIDLVIVNVKPFAPAIGAKLVGIDGKLNMLIENDKRTNAAIEDLQNRVSALEKTKWIAMGAGLFLGGGAGGLVGLLGG